MSIPLPILHAPEISKLIQLHRRELTASEYTLLRKVKSSMGGLLELLHTTGVGSVMMFSLNEQTKLANAALVAEAAEAIKAAELEIEDNASTTDSITIRNPSIVDVSAPSKKG